MESRYIGLGIIGAIIRILIDKMVGIMRGAGREIREKFEQRFMRIARVVKWRFVKAPMALEPKQIWVFVLQQES